MSRNCEVEIIADEGVSMPVYKTSGSAGADLEARLTEPIRLNPMERIAVPTGISIALPEGYEAQIRPRSGLALQKGITCLNSPGTIDSDYRGEIHIILINLGGEPVWIKNGDRIAQMVIAPVSQAAFTRRGALPDSERGSGGFGSTGI